MEAILIYQKLFKKPNKNEAPNFCVGGRGTSTKIVHIMRTTQKSTLPVQVRYSRMKSIRSVTQSGAALNFDVQDVLVQAL
ncbi:hypothetical protein GCM10026983_10570 [Gracilibacillus alcaliphilus]